jgi:hypothetical protein
MTSRLLLAAAALCFFLIGGHSTAGAQDQPVDPGLTAHEWGTFTSIAGAKGEAISWLPLAERDDLPGFVEHLRNSRTKGGQSGTVRMETPVLYFHATHQTTVSVHVSFSKGLLTEWYPHAISENPFDKLANAKMLLAVPDGEINWDSISIDPGGSLNFPAERAASRYYAARETSASPLTVNSPTGEQREKFLFYRGVASFRVPVTAIPMNHGRLLVSNFSQDTIPQAILFERRGERLGYRFLGIVRNSSVVDPPELTSNLGVLNHDLEKTLVEQGLYADEAHAMVQTWQDSWFEEGSRLLYIVPRSFVDGVLPLIIKPAPATTTRVFVGRMEIVTPATEKSIEYAFASHDHITLAKYGRFLTPILQTMIERSGDKSRIVQLKKYLSDSYGQLVAQTLPQP